MYLQTEQNQRVGDEPNVTGNIFLRQPNDHNINHFKQHVITTLSKILGQNYQPMDSSSDPWLSAT